MIALIIGALVVGLIVALVGTIFDKTPDNRYAWSIGGIVALLIFLSGFLPGVL